MKCVLVPYAVDDGDGRSPLRGAWIEMRTTSTSHSATMVAPPCGERGLKFLFGTENHDNPRRSPLRGAWIEISLLSSSPTSKGSRSPLRGAWIEILCLCVGLDGADDVAPPCGERGLKSVVPQPLGHCGIVAPPCGERGLKSRANGFRRNADEVAPPCGERGLKCFLASPCSAARVWRRSPLRGAWIEIRYPSSSHNA